MISRYWRHPTSTLIQVPHHGSNTSSSALLIRRVDGAAALRWPRFAYNAWWMPSYKGGSALPPAGLSLVRHAAAAGADNGGFFRRRVANP